MRKELEKILKEYDYWNGGNLYEELQENEGEDAEFLELLLSHFDIWLEDETDIDQIELLTHFKNQLSKLL